jgi:hypothetical protein
MKYKTKYIFYIFIFFCKVGLSQTPEVLFEKGNEFYNNGEFELGGALPKIKGGER